MQLRPGVYRLGETVQITGTFFNSSNTEMNAGDIKITIRRPTPDNSISLIGPVSVGLVDGSVYFEFNPDVIGTWKVRMQCDLPKSAVIESKFEVVPHK